MYSKITLRDGVCMQVLGTPLCSKTFRKALASLESRVFLFEAGTRLFCGARKGILPCFPCTRRRDFYSTDKKFLFVWRITPTNDVIVVIHNLSEGDR